MAKGPWESRVGMLLAYKDRFAWSFKPPDSALYGGQPRVDWLATDKLGRSWMVEVKQLPVDRRSINVMSEVTAGQRDALSAIAITDVGIALLAVGQGETLYLFDWRFVLWRLAQGEGILAHRLPLSSAPLMMRWTGKKGWTNNPNFYPAVVMLRQTDPSQITGPTLIELTGSPSKVAWSPSTLKPKGYTHTLQQTPL